jgi:dynein heavy chain 1
VTELTKTEEEQKSVKNKVERSDALFKNLSSELVRWQQSSLNFKDNMASLMGDVLLASGVLTYIGFFDHFQRQHLQLDWKDSIQAIYLKMSQTLSFIEFLSKPQERLLWQAQELPNDDLCITNAIIMKRYIRYPLVIDPSDQALKYIMAHYKEKKIQKTSF